MAIFGYARVGMDETRDAQGTALKPAGAVRVFPRRQPGRFAVLYRSFTQMGEALDRMKRMKRILTGRLI